jgi:hypothetical protein
MRKDMFQVCICPREADEKLHQFWWYSGTKLVISRRSPLTVCLRGRWITRLGLVGRVVCQQCRVVVVTYKKPAPRNLLPQSGQ